MSVLPAYTDRIIHGLFAAPPGSTLTDLRLPTRERIQMAAHRLNHAAWLAAQHGHEAHSESLYDKARRIAPSYAVTR